MREREPTIFYAFIAYNLVKSESERLRSFDSYSLKDEQVTKFSRLTSGLCFWSPNQNSATSHTVVHSISANECVQVFNHRTDLGSHITCNWTVSPDANYFIAHHQTYSEAEDCMALYRYKPNQRPQLVLEISNDFFVHKFNWSRDSRFCLWDTGWGVYSPTKPTFRAFQLFSSHSGMKMVTQHDIMLTDVPNTRDYELITLSDGRLFLLLYFSQSKMLQLFALDTSPSGDPLRTSKLVDISLHAIPNNLSFPFTTIDCELGIMYLLSSSDKFKTEINSVILPFEFLNNTVSSFECNLPPPSGNITSRKLTCRLTINPRGCAWAYETFIECNVTHSHQIRRKRKRFGLATDEEPLVYSAGQHCAQLVCLRSLHRTGDTVPRLLRLARAALYERPELLDSLESRGLVPPALLTTCLQLDPLTYMSRA